MWVTTTPIAAKARNASTLSSRRFTRMVLAPERPERAVNASVAGAMTFEGIMSAGYGSLERSRDDSGDVPHLQITFFRCTSRLRIPHQTRSLVQSSPDLHR